MFSYSVVKCVFWKRTMCAFWARQHWKTVSLLALSLSPLVLRVKRCKVSLLFLHYADCFLNLTHFFFSVLLFLLGVGDILCSHGVCNLVTWLSLGFCLLNWFLILSLTFCRNFRCTCSTLLLFCSIWSIFIFCLILSHSVFLHLWFVIFTGVRLFLWTGSTFMSSFLALSAYPVSGAVYFLVSCHQTLCTSYCSCLITIFVFLASIMHSPCQLSSLQLSGNAFPSCT